MTRVLKFLAKDFYRVLSKSGILFLCNEFETFKTFLRIFTTTGKILTQKERNLHFSRLAETRQGASVVAETRSSVVARDRFQGPSFPGGPPPRRPRRRRFGIGVSWNTRAWEVRT